MSYNTDSLTKLSALQRVTQHAKAAEDAAANALTGVKVNGTALTVANQVVDILIAAGSSNGAISVNNADVSVTGLAALAYKSEVAYADLASALQSVIDAKAENSTLSALIGSDTGKSARAIAGEEIAAQLIPENASASLDTLQEVAAWIQAHPADAAAMNSKLTLGTHSVTAYVAATGTYVSGTKYYTDDTGATEVDASGFTAGETDVSEYYVAQTTAPQYATVKDYVEAMVSGLITLSALSAETTGSGNAVTSLTYNSATGTFTATKGETFVTASQIASDAEATEALDEIFGAEGE